MNDDRNEADRILGEDRMDPRHLLLLKAMATHPERELIRELQRRRTRAGNAAGRFAASFEDDGWIEVWLRPWPLNRFDERAPIRVGSWPEKEAELDPLARARATTHISGRFS